MTSPGTARKRSGRSVWAMAGKAAGKGEGALSAMGDGRNRARRRAWVVVAAACLVAAGCGRADLAGPGGTGGAPGGTAGHYKVGNPYEINGVWYTPEEDFNYDETGLASWYGPGFHGNQTANGEIFDQDALTAAHPTLQMPTFVRVTNLDNGRSVVLRVNDRGPFVGNRIIDVSRRGAQLLGFVEAGVAEVRVQVLTEESRQLAARYDRGGALAARAAPERTVDHAELQRIAAAARTVRPSAASPTRASPPVPTRASSPAPSPAAAAGPAVTGPLFVQTGNFADIAGARRLMSALTPIDRGTIVEAMVNGVPTYRVQLGPYRSAESASSVLTRVVGAGHSDARLVR